MAESLLSVTANSVLTLTLNRPEALNSFTVEMKEALLAELKGATKDREVRVVVLTGAGRAFSAGQDLKERQEPGVADLGTELRLRYNPIILAMRRLEKPIIGAINGVAAGAGISIALACDIVIAAENATFIEAFARVGLVPDTGSTWFLPRLVGPARAAEMIFTADPVDAPTAERIGLINRVVPQDRLMEEANALATRLAKSAPIALALAKRALNRAFETRLDEALDYEAQLQSIAGRSADHREGVAAFVEKRARPRSAVSEASPGAAAPLIVGVVGAGTMGAGIAQVCLQAGHEVQLHDVDHAAIERGRARIADGLQKLVERDRLAPDERQQMLDSVHDAQTLEGLAQETDLVIEAALEDLDLKQTVFRALGASARPDTILATNTSALSVTDIAESSGVLDRVLGLHFFNPAPLMPLVEVVVTARTSRATLERAISFVEGIGKEPIRSADSPGFVVNRVNRPFTLEALRMLEAGEAGAQQIDRAVEAAGYPMGPFALMDLVGIDVNLAVASALFDGFDEAVRFTPSAIQRGLVAAGRLGRKTGEGFYRYDEGRSTGLSASLAEVGVQAPAEESTVSDDQIVERIELAIINEAYHAAGEGVAQPPDIDRAMKLGANHPYGPFERAGQLGLRQVIDGLRRLEGTHGERYRVAPALWQVASM